MCLTAASFVPQEFPVFSLVVMPVMADRGPITTTETRRPNQGVFQCCVC